MPGAPVLTVYAPQPIRAVVHVPASMQALAQAMPSLNSRDYGRGFAELFTAAGYDFYKLAGALFAPAEVWVSHLGSGRTWHGGGLEMALEPVRR